jgi:hypothetical protein
MGRQDRHDDRGVDAQLAGTAESRGRRAHPTFLLCCSMTQDSRTLDAMDRRSKRPRSTAWPPRGFTTRAYIPRRCDYRSEPAHPHFWVTRTAEPLSFCNTSGGNSTLSDTNLWATVRARPGYPGLCPFQHRKSRVAGTRVKFGPPALLPLHPIAPGPGEAAPGGDPRLAARNPPLPGKGFRSKPS